MLIRLPTSTPKMPIAPTRTPTTISITTLRKRLRPLKRQVNHRYPRRNLPVYLKTWIRNLRLVNKYLLFLELTESNKGPPSTKKMLFYSLIPYQTNSLTSFRLALQTTFIKSAFTLSLLCKKFCPRN